MGYSSFASKIKNLFGAQKHIDSDFFELLSDTLVEGDVGAKTAFETVEELEKRCKERKLTDYKAIRDQLRSLLLESVKSAALQPDPAEVNVHMLLGVNGAGKTTAAAKLASFYKNTGKYNVIMAAADTFRAAAIEQLCYHGEKLGVRVVCHSHGADPSAVVFDACEAAAAKGGGIVLADTAGRLHNKENLVRELQKIDRVASSKASQGAYKKILVLDCTTGQNAFRQAEVFHEAVGIDALFLTKYDSTAKGGAVFSIGRELGIPVSFVGFGENYADIAPFNPERYAADFIGE